MYEVRHTLLTSVEVESRNPRPMWQGEDVSSDQGFFVTWETKECDSRMCFRATEIRLHTRDVLR